MSERVRITREGSLATLTLTRADKHNGMDFPMLREVVAAQDELRKMRDVRTILLRGEGPSFCAGLDFKSVLAKPVVAAAMATQLFWPVRNTFQRWSVGFRDLGACVIAVVHGNCFGAGLQLALGADLRIATPDARLSVMEAKWGLVPDMGGAALMRDLLPLDVAKELTFTGRVLSGTDAHALGLVTHVSADPLAHALSIAKEIETRSPDAIAAGKALLQEAYDGSHREALSAERHWQRRLMGSPNQRIAMAKNRGEDDRAFAPRKYGA